MVKVFEKIFEDGVKTRGTRWFWCLGRVLAARSGVQLLLETDRCQVPVLC